jgi:hypothetical protein
MMVIHVWPLFATQSLSDEVESNPELTFWGS